jgi:hypothetical protein
MTTSIYIAAWIRVKEGKHQSRISSYFRNYLIIYLPQGLDFTSGQTEKTEGEKVIGNLTYK